MTSMFTWRDESGAPCAIVKNALDLVGSKNLINELKDKATKGTHIQSDGSVTNDEDDVRNSDVFWFNDLGFITMPNFSLEFKAAITIVVNMNLSIVSPKVIRVFPII